MPYQIPAVISLGGYFELRSIPTKSSRSPFEYSGRYDVCVRVVILPSACSILVSGASSSSVPPQPFKRALPSEYRIDGDLK
jgi:hypothetical protein